MTRAKIPIEIATKIVIYRNCFNDLIVWHQRSPSPDKIYSFLKKTDHYIFIICLLCALPSSGQDDARQSIAMISDTQAPMRIEKLFLKSDHNEKATAILFEQIVKLMPEYLFILGDVTSCSAKERKWDAMDGYLQACRNSGINVSALFGNH